MDCKFASITKRSWALFLAGICSLATFGWSMPILAQEEIPTVSEDLPGDPSAPVGESSDEVPSSADALKPISGEDEVPLAGLEPKAIPIGESPAAAAPVAGSTDVYTIQSGDTLWDISGRFFEKPEYWPKLWSYNQYITNPHWIFPNNRLVFRPGSETKPPSVEVAPPVGEAGTPPVADAGAGAAPEVPAVGDEAIPAAGSGTTPELSPSEVAAAESAGIMTKSGKITLREDGYISNGDEPILGKIAGSKMEIAELAEAYEIYLDMNDAAKVQVGDRYSVVRKEKRVLGLGTLIKVLGIVEIKEIGSKSITAIVRRSYYPMQRGDLVREYYDAIHEVALTESTTAVEGEIVERLNYNTIDIGQGDVVYIDRGNRDGVEAGYEFLVLRNGDGMTKKKSSLFPEEIVGRLVVVVARADNSTAVVVQSKDSLHIGDRIATRRKE